VFQSRALTTKGTKDTKETDDKARELRDAVCGRRATVNGSHFMDLLSFVSFVVNL
jgi:hypothetical protein